MCIGDQTDFCGPIAENVGINPNDDNSYDLWIGDRKCGMFGPLKWNCLKYNHWHDVGARRPGKFYIEGDFANTIRDSNNMPIFIARILYRQGEIERDMGEFKFKPVKI